MDGWIKIHRKILDWRWYSDLNTRVVFFHLLLTANHKDKEWQGLTVKRGQVVVGRIKLAKDIGISERAVRTAINKLKTTSELTSKSTNKYTVLTIINYDKYQLNDQQVVQQTSSKRPANDHYQECKEVKNERINTMQTSSQGDAQVEKLLKEKTGTAYEYQDAGLSVWQELKAPEDKKGEFIRVFKNERSIAESAFRFSVDHPSANLRWKMFFWKYNQLLKLKPKA